MKAFVRVVRDVGLLLARLAFGVVMVLHGWARWTGAGGMGAQAEHLRAHGVPNADLVAWGAMALEVFGGVLICFGAFVPPVAFLFLVEQVLVIVLIKWSHGVYLTGGGFEANLLAAAVAALLLCFGSGRAGVDALFRKPAYERQVRDGGGATIDADPA